MLGHLSTLPENALIANSHPSDEDLSGGDLGATAMNGTVPDTGVSGPPAEFAGMGLRVGDMLTAMNSSLAALQARQTVSKMNQLTGSVRLFATHASTLRGSSGSFDSLPLLQEADRLLKMLGDVRLQFLNSSSKIETLARSLPSRPPQGGGISPAAQWVPELRAASKQFTAAVRLAEGELQKLYSTALTGMNSPTRTPTGLPGDLFEALVNFADLLARWIEHVRGTHGK